MCVAKLLFDQNISYKLVARLESLYPDSVHVEAVGLQRASDKEVWNYAKKNGYTLVSKDSDFNDLCTLYGFPPHIIWIRVGNSSVLAIEDILKKYKEMICDFVQENKNGIIEFN